MHVDLGGYHIRDIEFSAAFDIDKDKVGKDLADAIFAGHNNTVKFADVPHLGVRVERGMTHDGLGKYLSEIITKAPGPTADIVGILKETKTDVVVNYLPVGSEEAGKWYAEQVLEAGCAFVNCMPVFLAREPYWRRRFNKRGIPMIAVARCCRVGIDGNIGGALEVASSYFMERQPAQYTDARAHQMTEAFIAATDGEPPTRVGTPPLAAESSRR